ncbi:MAG TPA: L-type lectin-domain containing protein [Solirubrobacterales bacterium]|nr:L-type lectin-domain containing protein [Solirubrobacterales bacterium]
MIRRLGLVSISLLTMFALAAPAGAASFHYPDFASTAGLQLNGDAKQEGNLLRLTPALSNEAGSVFATTPVDVQKSWQTQFQIAIHDHTCCDVRPADGIAFVLQGAGLSGGSGLGGSLGYGGVKPSVAVEFDVFENPGEPAGDHVAIMAEGDPSKHLACANEGGPSGGCAAALPLAIYGAPVHAWVEYDVVSQHLKVFLASTGDKPAAPLLDHQISLAPLGASPYAGFTAATGSHNAVQDVLSWRFGQAEPTATLPIAPPITSPETKKAAKKPCPPFRGKGKKGKGAKASAGKAKKKGKAKGKKCGHKKKGHKKPGKGKGRG